MGPLYDEHQWDDIKNLTLDDLPSNWTWEQVQKWLYETNLWIMWDILDGIEGYLLLNLNREKLTNDFGDYQAIDRLAGILGDELYPDVKETEIMKIIDIFLHELAILRFIETQYEIPDTKQPAATMNDLNGLRTSIKLFIEKWDRVQWIEQYTNTHNYVPSSEVVVRHLGLIGTNEAEIYIEYYNDQQKHKQDDLSKLFSSTKENEYFLWWVLILTEFIHRLPVWAILYEVAEQTPGNVAVELLATYENTLLKCPEERIHELTQRIVFDSQYPICTTLYIANWYNELANKYVDRGDIFNEYSEIFVQCAINYVELIESDHAATIILETKSNFDDMSAIDIAQSCQLDAFLATNRMERISKSMMNTFEFLKPENRAEAFMVKPFSVDLLWNKLLYNYKSFYFTGLGLYTTNILLYLSYLILFSCLSVENKNVYSAITS
eukprot:139281_1